MKRFVSGEGIVERSPNGRYLRFSEKLGSGAFKHVYRAYDTRGGIEVAWNVVNLMGVPKYDRNRIINEVRLLERLHHPNIISFHGSWVDRERQEVHFITEILSAGSLKSFIMKVQVIRWKIAKRWLKQILEGLAYMHSQGVIHRDLKCDNIFIDGTSGDLRIGDMGLCTAQRGNGPASSVLGTPEFMAPDMYEEHIPYDEKIDIYSFGMCMLEICTHETPYIECSNPAQIYRKVSRSERPRSLNRIRSQEARNFILLCLGRKDTSGSGKYMRPSAVQLLSHPFLSAADNDDDVVFVDPPQDKHSISISTQTTASVVSVLTDTLDTIEGSQILKSSGPMETISSGSSSKEKEESDGEKIDEKISHEDITDPFLDMPQNESGFSNRQVTVLSGRGKIWKAGDAKKQQVSEEHRQKEQLSYSSPSTSTSSSIASKPNSSVGSRASESTPSTGNSTSKPTSSIGSRASKISSSIGSVTSKPTSCTESRTFKPTSSIGSAAVRPKPASSIGSATNHEIGVLNESQPASKTSQGSKSHVSFSSQQGSSEATVEDMMQNQLYQQQQQLKYQEQQLQQLQLQQQQLQQQKRHQQQYQQEYPQQQLQWPQSQQLNEQQLRQKQLQQQQQPQPQQQVENHHLVAADIVDMKDTTGQGGLISGQCTKPTSLPLLLTLPVQGLTQNVHFDFDLVQDNPIKVAREMVSELGIPEEAVLEISETISGLTSAARIKREERQQVLQQKWEDKEEQLVQQMKDLATQHREQQEQQKQRQLQIQQQQHQIHMQEQQHQLQQQQILKHHHQQQEQQRQTLLLQSQSPASPQIEHVETTTPGSELAAGLFDNKEESSDDDEFNKELARIDKGFRYSMAQAREVYDNRINNLQQEQSERDQQHLETLEKHEKEQAEFHMLMREAQKEENRRVDELQCEWDERRKQLTKERNSRLGLN